MFKVILSFRLKKIIKYKNNVKRFKCIIIRVIKLVLLKKNTL